MLPYFRTLRHPAGTARSRHAVHAVPEETEETHRTGSREMTLVPAQENIVDPPRRFEARRIR
jgi:pyridoxal/pyridoxine/pyridoxamine kinase